MPEWLSAVIAGIVEGVTEFLPISSTGHLILTSELLQFDALEGGTFEIFIQIGAVIAVIFFYRAELLQQAQNVVSTESSVNTNARQLWLGVVVAFIPAAVLGLLFDDYIEEILFGPVPVGIALIVGGIMFIVVETMLKRQENDADTEDTSETVGTASIESNPLTYRQALWVGLWQVLALIPGMSRSGMSIIGGMISGLDRERATQFSFYLAMPTLGAATLYTLLRNLDTISADDLWLLTIGTVVSGIVAWFSIGWLLRYVATNSFVLFGYYRIVVGIIVLVVVNM
ncbi:MAG: undecaprenyl-diphosphate phosphatase [Chloroflexota bacterium]